MCFAFSSWVFSFILVEQSVHPGELNNHGAGRPYIGTDLAVVFLSLFVALNAWKQITLCNKVISDAKQVAQQFLYNEEKFKTHGIALK
jgi:hypothetical protein